MNHRTALAGVLTAGLAGITGGIAPVQAAAPDWCAAGVTLDAAALPARFATADCNLTGRTVRSARHGLSVEVPAPGRGVTVSSYGVPGSPGGTLSVAVREDGTTTVSLGGDGASAYSSPAACSDNARTYLRNEQNELLYNWGMSWYFNSSTAPTTTGVAAAETAIRNGMNNVTNGVNDCGLNYGPYNTYNTYAGRTTTRFTQIDNGGGCHTGDWYNVVAFGTLPTGTLAVACSYWYTNEQSIVEADIKFNGTLYVWTTNPGSASCTNWYDIAAVMTHEAGHTYGQGHVAEATHGNLTMSDQSNGPCQSSERTLGYGDMIGINSLYSP